jgi:2-keto-4-pentenoate hydratase
MRITDTSPVTADDAVQTAARRLRDAVAHRTPCLPVRDLFEQDDIDAAYAVQTANIGHGIEAGHHLSGRKIGLTSAAVQRQLGVDQPDFGELFSDMAYGSDELIPFGRLLQPRAEAEVAFVLGSDLPANPVTVVDVVRAIDFAVPALEIVDSRVANWDISIVDTIADNASSGVYVVGTRPVRLADLDLPAIDMVMEKDGSVVSRGTGAACMGDPLNAVVWLANAAARFGVPLRAGEVVLSGALGPVVPVTPGSRFEARFSQLGTVRASFTSKDAT